MKIIKFFLFAILILIYLIHLRIFLTTYGFNRLTKKISSDNKAFNLSINYLTYITKLIPIISKLVPRCSCLIKASCLKILFSNYKGIKLKIGINNEDGFESHAWIDYGDKVILNMNNKIDKYKIIYTL